MSGLKKYFSREEVAVLDDFRARFPRGGRAKVMSATGFGERTVRSYLYYKRNGLPINIKGEGCISTVSASSPTTQRDLGITVGEAIGKYDPFEKTRVAVAAGIEELERMNAHVGNGDDLTQCVMLTEREFQKVCGRYEPTTWQEIVRGPEYQQYQIQFKDGEIGWTVSQAKLWLKANCKGASEVVRPSV